MGEPGHSEHLYHFSAFLKQFFRDKAIFSMRCTIIVNVSSINIDISHFMRNRFGLSIVSNRNQISHWAKLRGMRASTVLLSILNWGQLKQ